MKHSPRLFFQAELLRVQPHRLLAVLECPIEFVDRHVRPAPTGDRSLVLRVLVENLRVVVDRVARPQCRFLLDPENRVVVLNRDVVALFVDDAHVEIAHRELHQLKCAVVAQPIRLRTARLAADDDADPRIASLRRRRRRDAGRDHQEQRTGDRHDVPPDALAMQGELYTGHALSKTRRREPVTSPSHGA